MKGCNDDTHSSQTFRDQSTLKKFVSNDTYVRREINELDFSHCKQTFSLLALCTKRKKSNCEKACSRETLLVRVVRPNAISAETQKNNPMKIFFKIQSDLKVFLVLFNCLFHSP